MSIFINIINRKGNLRLHLCMFYGGRERKVQDGAKKGKQEERRGGGRWKGHDRAMHFLWGFSRLGESGIGLQRDSRETV